MCSESINKTYRPVPLVFAAVICGETPDRMHYRNRAVPAPAFFLSFICGLSSARDPRRLVIIGLLLNTDKQFIDSVEENKKEPITMSISWTRRSASQIESFLSTFGFAYTFIGIYFMVNVLLFLREAVIEANMHEDFQKYVTGIARGCGATINFNLGVALLLASRSFIGFIRETPLSLVLPIDKAMPEFHQVVGILVMYAGILHSIMHWVTYIIKRPWSPGLSGLTSLFATGMILLILFVVIRVVARPAVWQANYELFHRVHIGGSVVAFIVILLHGFHRGELSTWKWVLTPIIVYVLDFAFRSFREQKSYLLVSKHSAVFQSQDILKIRLPRVLHFQAGQYAELKVPDLSHLQWHPFTIASAPHEPEMIFYIKAVGNWTRALYQLFHERISRNGTDIEIHIRGPFGAPAQHVGQFDHVILIGGGVGATPFCSVVKDAYNWMTNWTPQDQQRSSRNGQVNSVAAKQRRGTRESSRHRNQIDRPRGRPRQHSSHFLTTNVFTEDMDTVELDAFDRQRSGSFPEIDDHSDRHSGRNRRMGGRDSVHDGQTFDDSTTTVAGYSDMQTARDHISTLDNSHSESLSSSTTTSDVSLQYQQRTTPAAEIPLNQGLFPPTQIQSARRKRNTTFTRPSDFFEDEMGSYRDNSTGPLRSSVDYMSALFSAFNENENHEVFQKSLDMMVSLKFGSASLVRTVRMRQTQKAMQQPAQLPVVSGRGDLGVFHNPRVMFLLYMRSVTINMLLLWILLLRVALIGIAHVFGGLDVFSDGVALFKLPALTAIDLVFALLISMLVGIPSVLEVVILGAAPVHTFDLFVLTPVALFGVVADILALANVGEDVHLFGVVHLFVLWPLLGILIMIRLLRVVGERIAQAENMSHTHASTRRVDFYWTAPYPDDDQWLVGELNRFADLRSVQLHRYLTRCDENASINDDEDAVYLHTNFGRPNWDEVLNETADRCRNNSTVGVFFCGPHAMGAAVQEACMGAMRNSIIRGLHSGARAMRGLEEVFGEAVSANEYTGETIDGKPMGSRGCNVRFVFKRETFA